MIKLDKIETMVFCYYLQFDPNGAEDYVNRIQLRRAAS